MKLNLKTKRQAEIAQLLWEAQEVDELEKIMERYGNDAVTIYNLIIAEYIDTMEPNVDIADLMHSLMKRK